jgi:hypothetical protein
VAEDLHRFDPTPQCQKGGDPFSLSPPLRRSLFVVGPTGEEGSALTFVPETPWGMRREPKGTGALIPTGGGSSSATPGAFCVRCPARPVLRIHPLSLPAYGTQARRPLSCIPQSLTRETFVSGGWAGLVRVVLLFRRTVGMTSRVPTTRSQSLFRGPRGPAFVAFAFLALFLQFRSSPARVVPGPLESPSAGASYV